MSIAKQIDEVIRGCLARLLKTEGFRKSGRTFHRPAGPAVEVVNVQASQFNLGDVGKFTLNLGLYFRGIDDLLGDPPLEHPKEYECQLRARIGALMGSGDHWWTLGATTSPSDVAPAVEQAYREHGRPWLDMHRDPVTASDWLVGRIGPSQEALALAILGEDHERGGVIVRAVLADPHTPIARAERVRRWADTYGLRFE